MKLANGLPYTAMRPGSIIVAAALSLALLPIALPFAAEAAERPGALDDHVPPAPPAPPATDRPAPAPRASSPAPSRSADTGPPETLRRTLERLRRQLTMTSRPDIVAAARTELSSITDPGALREMAEILGPGHAGTTSPDNRALLLEHFARQDEAGQQLLMVIALTAELSTWASEARQHLQEPPIPAVTAILRRALFANDERIIERAVALVDEMALIDMMPDLLNMQFMPVSFRREADDPWSVQTQFFLDWGEQALRLGRRPLPFLFNNTTPLRFRGLLGYNEFYTIPRLRDGVDVNPLPRRPAPRRRMNVRDALLSLAGQALGRPVTDVGSDAQRWRAWYQDDFLPEVQALAKQEEHRERMLRAIDEAFEHADREEPW